MVIYTSMYWVQMGITVPEYIFLICDDAGGGCPRGREFPRSMSDYKPGEPIFT